jgi:type VI secretion system protein ImpJ
LPGLTLRHVQVPPAQIRIRLDNQYFALNQSGDLWKAIRAARRVSVSATAEINQPKMELLVVTE